MVADLPQLHDGVHQGLGAALTLQRPNTRRRVRPTDQGLTNPTESGGLLTSRTERAPPPHLLVLLGAVSEQDPLGLHVAVEDPLERRHVALDHVLHLEAQQGGGSHTHTHTHRRCLVRYSKGYTE